MAILVGFVTVVTRIETVKKKYPGGVDAYVNDNLVGESHRDQNLIGVVFMSTAEAQEFIEKLVNLGFNHVINNKCKEIAVIDQFIGLFSPCDWIETRIRSLLDRELKESICWLKESAEEDVIGP